MTVRSNVIRVAVASVLFMGCKDGTGPSDAGFTVAAQSGDAQFGTRSTALFEPLQVIVVDPVNKQAESGVIVRWSIIEGAGATLTAATSTTNAAGVATTQLKLGEALGTYRVQATVDKMIGNAAKFTARAVNPPSITTIAPTAARAGDTLVITGENFSPTAEENVIVFGGFRGKVTSASATQLRVVVPLCVPARDVVVQAFLGAVAGTNQKTLPITSSSGTQLELARGQVRTMIDPNDISCFRAPGTANASFLVVVQNYSQVSGSVSPFTLAGLTGAAGPILIHEAPAVTHASAADSWEMRLRARERALPRDGEAMIRSQSSQASCPTPAQIGNRCDFKVLDKDQEFASVTAEIKAISAHAIVYEDINAPANGLTANDFSTLATTFDNPIYDAVTAAFGQPSDLDKNGKIIILLTPVVNQLTPKGSAGFVAGFFYGCDLLSKNSCSGTNESEIFYALSVDPTGQFGDVRSRSAVLNSLPAVIAHEFQHMINFAARGNTNEALWLSEGMAHHAEDVVADVYEARGDNTNRDLFRSQNNTRGSRYLQATSTVSLLAESALGSLEQRGGAWLFVKYLAGQFGPSVLINMTKSTKTSVDNVTTVTGKPWSTLQAEWGVALWADNATELLGVNLNPVYTYPNMNMRTRFGSGQSFPLRPDIYGYEDFVHRESLPASSSAYIRVTAGATLTPKPLHMTLGGQHGGSFAVPAAPQVSILRIQ